MNLHRNPLRFAPWWYAAGYLMLGAITVLSLTNLSSVEIAQDLNDKVAHVLAYFVLMVWFGGVAPDRHYRWVIGGLFAYGIVIELVQSLTGYRSMDPLDAVADLVGILLGWLLLKAGFNNWCAWVEARLGIHD